VKLISLTRKDSGEERAVIELRNGAYVYITHTHEGVIVDVWSHDTAAESVGTLCVSNEDLEPEEDESWHGGVAGVCEDDGGKVLLFELNDGGCIEAPDSVGTIRRRDADGCLMETRTGNIVDSWTRGSGYFAWTQDQKKLRRTLETAPDAASQNEVIRLRELADALEWNAAKARELAASAVLLDEGVVH
jgi:hypothetical protein